MFTGPIFHRRALEYSTINLHIIWSHKILPFFFNSHSVLLIHYNLSDETFKKNFDIIIHATLFFTAFVARVFFVWDEMKKSSWNSFFWTQNKRNEENKRRREVRNEYKRKWRWRFYFFFRIIIFSSSAAIYIIL